MTMTSWCRVGAAVVCCLTLGATSAPAATFTVDRFDDANGSCTPGDCSLREALLAASATPEADTVILPAGTHTLSIPAAFTGDAMTGGLEVQNFDVDILAPDGATIDAQGVGRVLRFLGSTAHLENLTITGGSEPSSAGGGIVAEVSTLNLSNVWITGNVAEEGGGLALLIGRIVLDRCAITGNTALNSGGGAYVLGVNFFTSPGELDVVNSTISGNATATVGGAVHAVGVGALSFEYSTVVNNSNREGERTIVGLLFNGDRSKARYSLIEGSCYAGVDEKCIVLSSLSDQVPVADLGLAPLALGGGRTPTHRLLPGSPAIDVVPAAEACPGRDQRGSPRPQDGDGSGEARCDAGAYELAAPAASIPGLGPVSGSLLIAILALIGIGAARGRA